MTEQIHPDTESNKSDIENEPLTIKKEENYFNSNTSESSIKIESNDDNGNNDQLDRFSKMSREKLIEICKASHNYITNLELKINNLENELLAIKSTGDYQKQTDHSYREKILMRKIALKDQELQNYLAQLNELKNARIPSLSSLKSTLLDPAVNLIIQKLKNELSVTKANLEETKNELSAWKFTPDSNTGKRLMAKCRVLLQENEELGKMISSGRISKLENELALNKNFSEEAKNSQDVLDELLQDLDEDVEGMQGTILLLQQELKKCKERMADLETKNQNLFNECESLKNSKSTDKENTNTNEETNDEAVSENNKLEKNNEEDGISIKRTQDDEPENLVTKKIKQ